MQQPPFFIVFCFLVSSSHIFPMTTVTYETADSVVIEFVYPKKKDTKDNKKIEDEKDEKKEAKTEPTVPREHRENTKSKDITKKFFSAVRKGNLDAAKMLYTQAKSQKIYNLVYTEEPKDGWTPLHFAATRGDYAMVAFLLEKHAFVNAQTKKDNHTPLSLAVRHGYSQRLPENYTRTINLLLTHGAISWLKDTQGLPAQAYALREDAELESTIVDKIGTDQPTPVTPPEPDIITKIIQLFSTIL